MMLKESEAPDGKASRVLPTLLQVSGSASSPSAL
jgi:hypothetical protein